MRENRILNAEWEVGAEGSIYIDGKPAYKCIHYHGENLEDKEFLSRLILSAPQMYELLYDSLCMINTLDPNVSTVSRLKEMMDYINGGKEWAV